MREIELTAREWLRIKRTLVTSGAEAALAGYEPPVKLTCGNEYVIFEKGNDDGTETDR